MLPYQEKIFDFEKELKHFDFSPNDDSLKVEEHFYNGFSGSETHQVYYKHLEKLYNDYISILNRKIDDNVLTSAYLNGKLILFAKIKEFWNDNYIIEVWQDTIASTLQHYMNNSNARNEKDKLCFFSCCVGSQIHFLDEIIDYITKLCNTYNPQPQPEQSQLQKKTIESNRTLEDYFIASFKGMGNGNIDYFNTLVDELEGNFTAKEFAQIALMIYNSKKLNNRKPKTFKEWYKLFCMGVGCEQKTYTPNKLQHPKERITRLFNYLL